MLYTCELTAPCHEEPWEDFTPITPASQLRQDKALSLTKRGEFQPRESGSRTWAVNDSAQKMLGHRGEAPTSAWGLGCSSLLSVQWCQAAGLGELAVLETGHWVFRERALDE